MEQRATFRKEVIYRRRLSDNLEYDIDRRRCLQAGLRIRIRIIYFWIADPNPDQTRVFGRIRLRKDSTGSGSATLLTRAGIREDDIYIIEDDM